MLSIIVATDIEGGIGKENDLLFHIREDLQRFKELTTGHTIIMGRKTFESLPNGALPNRENVVITRGEVDYDNVTIVDDLCKVIIGYLNTKDEAFVIGGGTIYEQLLPYCDKIYLTKIHATKEADTFFKFNEEEFVEVKRELKEAKDFYYEFIDLERK